MPVKKGNENIALFGANPVSAIIEAASDEFINRAGDFFSETYIKHHMCAAQSVIGR